MLDQETCYRALQTRDARFDGRFFTGVKTTGIYCRPVCPARTPHAHNVTFYACAAGAEQAGFRPCKRCRPELAPGGAGWRGSSAAVERALRLIEAGALDEGSVEQLAERVGLGARQLGRLFIQHMGATPVAVAQTRRVHFARGLIEQTTLPMVEVAGAAGFGSLRRFNALIKQTFGDTPSALRERAGGAQAGLVCRLAVREPYDWEQVLRTLGAHAIEGVERVEGGVYRRTIRWGGQPGSVEVWRGGAGHLMARLELGSAVGAIRAVERVRRMFDCDADPEAIGAVLGADPLLADAVSARPGLRLLCGWEPFEVAARAIVEQQVSVKAARTLGARVVARCGEEVEGGWLFPTPTALAGADLSGLGLVQRRIDALRTLAQAVDSGRLVLDGALGVDALVRALCALPGIGEWTAQYIALRGLGEPDAFPGTDLVIRRAMEGEDVEARAQGWRPWRGYAALHLWAAQTL
jgi:AraC family transcriptional regulator, regulatory protein of adaptative response / DNA-3-methyladenine glycosylase II